MEYLIKRGVPMRTGHATVGQLVALCDSKKCRLADLSIADLQVACPLIDDSVYDILGTKNAMAALQSYGSGGVAAVEEQVAYWTERLGASPAD